MPSPSRLDTEPNARALSTEEYTEAEKGNYTGCQSPWPERQGIQHICEVLPSQVYTVLSTDNSPTKAYYVQVLEREAPILKYSLGEYIGKHHVMSCQMLSLRI